MTLQETSQDSISRIWELARAGDLRGGAVAARQQLSGLGGKATPRERVELHLAAACCAMRQGHHADALRDLNLADVAAAPAAERDLALRVDVWRAELAYFQGRYSAAIETLDRVQAVLEANADWTYAAFALRVRIAILLARADYAAVTPLADRAIRAAEASGDDYVMVQILNILGAVRFDCATSKLAQPHARSHLSSLDPHDMLPMEEDAREALRLFQRAREVAERSNYEFAAWYVAGNIERLEILLGHADRAVRAIRKRLHQLQARGARYDEIVTRSNLAWGLRTMGRYPEALHELDVALALARETWTSNVLLEFLYYDRSVVLYALGDAAGASASYRRYVQLVGKPGDAARNGSPVVGPGIAKRPLEPYFLKQADRFIHEHAGETVTIASLSAQCGVSERTLQKAFTDFRGVTPVAHMRNVRLDLAHQALAGGMESVHDVAERYGFRSVTTFSLEYRKRFGTPPSRSRRAAHIR
jgi:AraC-like DNA-binding protein/tetratricopeptide (TPR) repeat protein